MVSSDVKICYCVFRNIIVNPPTFKMSHTYFTLPKVTEIYSHVHNKTGHL